LPFLAKVKSMSLYVFCLEVVIDAVSNDPSSIENTRAMILFIPYF